MTRDTTSMHAVPEEKFLYVFKGAATRRRRPPAPARRACGLSRPVPPHRTARPPVMRRAYEALTFTHGTTTVKDGYKPTGAIYMSS